MSLSSKKWSITNRFIWLMLAFLALLSKPVFLQGQRTVDRNQTSSLANSVRPQIRSAIDRGRERGSRPLISIIIRFAKTPAQQTALDQLIAAQQDVTSPAYHNWLTSEEFAAQFGLDQASIMQMTEWLQDSGFTNIHVANGHDSVTFDGTVAGAERVFSTNIHDYDVDGEHHFANATEIFIPGTLQSAIGSVSGLDDFYPKPFAQVSEEPSPQYNVGTVHYLAAEDIQTIYDVKPLYNAGYTGSGVTLVIIGSAPIASNDSSIAAYRTLSGLPAIKLQAFPVNGTYSPDPDWLLEAYLDIEVAGAVAKGANIFYDFANDPSVALTDAIDNNRGQIISMSYGSCEAPVEPLEADFQKATSMGITLVSGSGDTGAAGCDGKTSTLAIMGLAVSYPNSSSYVTSVGGTTLSGGSSYWGLQDAFGGSALGYVSEAAWNDVVPGNPLGDATGGGFNKYFPKPSWQTGVGVPADSHRDVPDVAFAASINNQGYLLCLPTYYQNGYYTPLYCVNGFQAANGAVYLSGGGTSAAAPLFAGIVAIAHQKHAFSMGNINPNIYAAAASSSHSSIFHDITTGDNKVPCTVGTTDCTSGKMGYSAGLGYDLVSGWGSVDANAFVNAITSTTTTTSYALTVNSLNPSSGVGITVSPTDNNGSASGTTSFTRTYNQNTQVGLAAPGTAGGNTFSSWTGCSSAVGAICTVTMNAAKTVTATYIQNTTTVGTIGLSTPTITFPSQAIGTSSSGQLETLSNTGSVVLNTPTISLTGTNSSDFSIVNYCQTTLGLGGTCPVVVTFIPLGVGIRTATLLVMESNVSNSPLMITLNGTGVSPISAPTVATGAASSVTSSSATLSGMINPNGNTTDYWFLYGKDPLLVGANYSANYNMAAGNTMLTIQPVTITGLTSGTTYYYQLKAQDSTSVSSGAILSFTTASAPDFTVTSPSITISKGSGPGVLGYAYIYITPINGFSGDVSLSNCIVPANFTNGNCSVPSGSVFVNGSTTIVGPIPISSTAVTVQLMPDGANPNRRGRPIGEGLILVSLLLFIGCPRKRSGSGRLTVNFLALLALACGLSACGAGTASQSGNVNTGSTLPSTLTVLTASTSQAVYGSSIIFTATVSSTGSKIPTGYVYFYDGSGFFNSGPLSSGIVSVTTSNMTVGPHSISADYGGDANNDPSVSSPLPETITTSAPTIPPGNYAFPVTVFNGTISHTVNIPVVVQ